MWHIVVLNIAICGDWAGAVYNSGGTCADAVGNSTNYDCTSSLGDCFGPLLTPFFTTGAQTKINYVSVYQQA